MEDDRLSGRLHGEQPDPGEPDNIFVRLLYMVLIWAMLSIANTILTAATVIQFIIMLVNNKQPNARLGEFGTDLGVWIAKAARFQTGASEVKPWPWTDFD
jgi:hypothetical protein